MESQGICSHLPLYAHVLHGIWAVLGATWTGFNAASIILKMPNIPDFLPKEHEAVLRMWIAAVFDKHGHSDYTLDIEIQKWTREKNNHQQIDEWKNEKGWKGTMWKRNAIHRFVDPKNKTKHSSPDKMRGMWLYLSSHTHYADCFPKSANADIGTIPSLNTPHELLAFALENFFCETENVRHEYTLEKLKRFLPGRYELYQIVYAKPELHEMQPRELIRASRIEISATDYGLLIKETMDFPQTPEREPYYEVNSGTIIPYGSFVIAIMKSEQTASFKCLVLKDFFPANEDFPVNDFNGKMLAATNSEHMPSTEYFFCKRIHGKERHGVYDPSALQVLAEHKIEGRRIRLGDLVSHLKRSAK